jgi:hypothetical protein
MLTDVKFLSLVIKQAFIFAEMLRLFTFKQKYITTKFILHFLMRQRATQFLSVG